MISCRDHYRDDLEQIHFCHKCLQWFCCRNMFHTKYKCKSCELNFKIHTIIGADDEFIFMGGKVYSYERASPTYIPPEFIVGNKIPYNYYHQPILKELSYGTKDVILWIWTLESLLSLPMEIKLRILHFLYF